MLNFAALQPENKPLYDRFADHQIDNNTDAYTAAAQVLNILEEAK